MITISFCFHIKCVQGRCQGVVKDTVYAVGIKLGQTAHYIICLLDYLLPFTPIRYHSFTNPTSLPHQSDY